MFFPGIITETKSNFKDVPEDFWAKEEIEFLSSKGVIKGYHDGTFKPNNGVTRAQFAVFL
ncbi:S-layer homology domain-containing protein [Parageobacillus toebii]|uniref:S-layer homology domain-containing protein n=1 Tax=Parageobacillus toebii TaxID=153151 RepID=UPI0035C727A7